MNAAAELHADPSFAVVCSFFNKFGVQLGLKPTSFARLETLLSFDEHGKLERELVDIHVKLMRKIQVRSACHARWENALLKYCSLTPNLDAELRSLERYGYAHSPLSTRLQILKSLCEQQFEYNLKFRENILTSLSSSELRLLPVGIDCAGQAYWYQQDADFNLRIYSEEPDDQSGGTWTIRATSRDDLASLLAVLESGVAPAPAESGDGSAEASDDDDERKPAALPDEKPIDEKLSDSPVEQTAAADPQQPAVKIKSKKGTCMDTFQAELPPPKPRKVEDLQKVDSECDKSDDSRPDIPADLRPFIESRVMPRRSTRDSQGGRAADGSSQGSSNADSRPDSAQNGAVAAIESSDESVRRRASSHPMDGRALQTGRPASARSSDSDSDFVPLSELRKAAADSRSASGKQRRRRVPSESEESADSDGGEVCVAKERKKATEETLCKSCDNSANPQVLLLCDKCDDAWHTWCLRPALWYVPDDDWFCPKCQHAMLVGKLTAALAALDESLKKKQLDERKKKTAADRLQREMEFIGVSINNIIPQTDQNAEDGSDEGGNDSEADGSDASSEARRRRRRVKKKRRDEEERVQIVPIALGRSRRQTRQVDYKFQDFDEMIEEAVDDLLDGSKPQHRDDPIRPTGGAGRGKDMANILQADAAVNRAADAAKAKGGADSAGGRAAGAPPAAALLKKHKPRLTDLEPDVDSDQDTDEYKASSGSETPTDADEDEWLPEEEKPTRRSGRLRNQRTRSDDEFVVSGSDTSDRSNRRAGGRSKRRPAASSAKRRRAAASSDSEDSLVAKAKRRRGRGSSESSEEAYRPRRGGVQKGKYTMRNRREQNYKKLAGSDSEESDAESDGEAAAAAAKKEERPTGALTRKTRAVVSSDEGEAAADGGAWKPDDSESESSNDDDADEQAKGADAASPDDHGKKARQRIDSSGSETPAEEANEAEVDDAAPTQVKRDSVVEQSDAAVATQCASTSEPVAAAATGAEAAWAPAGNSTAPTPSILLTTAAPSPVVPLALHPMAPAFQHLRHTQPLPPPMYYPFGAPLTTLQPMGVPLCAPPAQLIVPKPSERLPPVAPPDTVPQATESLSAALSHAMQSDY